MFSQVELEIIARAMAHFIRSGNHVGLKRDEISDLADKVVSMQEPPEEDDE